MDLIQYHQVFILCDVTSVCENVALNRNFGARRLKIEMALGHLQYF